MRDAGFASIEILLTMTLIGVAFTGALLTEQGMARWLRSTRESIDDLAVAASAAEAAKADGERDFFHLVSAFAPDRPDCAAQDSCSGVRRVVTDASACTKGVETRAVRQNFDRPARETALPAIVTDAAEMAALGDDCSTAFPAGNWSAPAVAGTAVTGPGNATGIDAYQGKAYVTFDAPPYLRIFANGSERAYSNGFVGGGPFNAVDVARDPVTGRVYAYAAAVSPQLQIIDVTDADAPKTVSSAPLAGVSLKGAQAQGWRVRVYGGVAYMTARYMISSNPELHLFDVRDPASPRERGTGRKTGTSAYDILLHEQSVPSLDGARRRLAYFATTAPGGELQVLDVTDPERMTPLATCDLPGAYQATALALLGTTLYVGRDNVPGGGEDLYAFDASDPASAAFCVPIAKTDIGTDGYSRHVQALRAAGKYLFVATNNTTNAHGQMQVRSADPATGLSLLGTYSLPGMTENGSDLEGGFLYAAAATAPQLTVITGS